MGHDGQEKQQDGTVAQQLQALDETGRLVLGYLFLYFGNAQIYGCNDGKYQENGI